jgi:hypothetical protein
MRWPFWLPRSRPRRLCVVGLDVGPEVYRLAVLVGTPTRPESVCCAEPLSLPEGLVAHGEVLQPLALGQWLHAYLQAKGYQPQAMCIGLNDAWVSHHTVSLTAGLSKDDVVFQLQAEVQSALPDGAAEVCVDYDVIPEPAEAGELLYQVQALSRARMETVLRVAESAGWLALVVAPRRAALASPYDEAFGLALGAWRETAVNFLPHRSFMQALLPYVWWLRVGVSVIVATSLTAGSVGVFFSVPETKPQHTDQWVSAARAHEAAQQAHTQAKAAQQRGAEQSHWLKAHQALPSQSLQWSRVLGQASQGVRVVRLTQQAAHWTVHGEALSPSHAQQLVAQLKALDIWAQAPELLQLHVMPAASSAGLPVWQFRIEANLKAGA